MHPKPSELGSQAGVGLFSTMEGDHMGTTGVVSFWLFFDGFMHELELFCFFSSINMILWVVKSFSEGGPHKNYKVEM